MAFWALLNHIARCLKHLFKQHKGIKFSCILLGYDGALSRGHPCARTRVCHFVTHEPKFAKLLATEKVTNSEPWTCLISLSLERAENVFARWHPRDIRDMVCPCLSVTSCSDTPARKQNSLNCACCFHRRWSFGIQVHEKFASHSIWPYTSFLVSDKLDSTDPRQKHY
jgi:hypothetical protein